MPLSAIPPWDARLSDDQVAKLRAYVQKGGTILAEPADHAAEFTAGMRTLLRRMFPPKQYPGRELQRLPEDHGVYTVIRHDWRARPALLGASDGARTFFFLSEGYLAKAWQTNDVEDDAFALGMNHYLHRGDVETAIHWIAIAAEKPDAPVWYRVASAGLLAKEDMAPVAIDFLEEQRDATDDPAILALIDGRLARLRHDVLEKAFVRIRGEFRQRYGRDVTDPAELEVMRGPLPPDPYERGWILAADGVIRSAQREEELSAKAREAERELLMRK